MPPPLGTVPFVMPQPYELVKWYPHLSLEPCPALVTHRSKSAISVVAFPPDSRTGVIKDGVRHIDDPESFRIAPDEGGFWDYTEDQKVLRDLIGK